MGNAFRNQFVIVAFFFHVVFAGGSSGISGAGTTVCDMHIPHDPWEWTRFASTNNKTSNFSLSSWRKEKSYASSNNRGTVDTGARNNVVELMSMRLRHIAPTFVLSSEKIEDEKCRLDNERFIADLINMKLWALKMYDSSGKLPSGLLNGNVNQFGDHDECLSSISPDGEIRGQYCLAYFQVEFEHGESENEDIRMVFDLVQSHHAFKSKISDPGHRVPRFSAINWAICTPSSCSHGEIEKQLKDAVEHYTEGMDFHVDVRLDREMCHMRKLFRFKTSFVIISSLLLSVVAVVIVSTVRDYSSKCKNNKGFLNCFSLRRNGRELLRLSRSPDDIESVHGIRMINAVLLLLSHKSMAMFYYPFTNRTYLVERLSQSWTILARTASLYTDSFIMISGTLTAYAFVKTLKKDGGLNVKNEFANRLCRIFPLLILTILLSTFIIPELGTGPLWPLTVGHYSRACRDSWWKNFLFIHNYFGFENMCLTHTHHLGIDTQLFFTSPFLVYLLHKWQLVGISILVLIAAASTALRYQSTLSKNLSYFIFPGISVKQMMDTANHSYIIPSHRMTVYAIGLILGYLLQQVGSNYKMNSCVRRFAWIIVAGLLYYVVSRGMNMSRLGYVYDKNEAAAFAALAPIAWCLVIGWIIFSSYNRYGGVIGRVLSWRLWTIWTRISYAVYLVQFPVFFYNVGQQRYPQEFSIFTLANLFEFGSVIAASVVLTLIFDMPAANIRRLIRERRTTKEEHQVSSSTQ